ncbi:hypothetical protein [Sorangium cellulosum]|uniref:hypothetical protein n=1 Tax=Sorangium cellulosum TaxID=56 RepID=UPI001331A322|nr:hypothetical protein [Sorangium cellulosum]
MLDVLHSDEFVDQPPPEVYATLLPRGVDLASIRTMYRLLAVSGESDERGAQRGPMTHAKPTLTATAPNQIWTWADVFYGRVEGIAARRQVALDAAYAAHPERFPNGPPIVRRPPASVAINPLSVDDAAGEAAAPPHTGTTSDAPEPGATPSAAARPQPLTSKSRNAPLNAIHS